MRRCNDERRPRRADPRPSLPTRENLDQGAAVAGLFDNDELFGWSSIGLAVGFLAYAIAGHSLRGLEWLGGGQAVLTS